MTARPPKLLYSVDDRPPPSLTALLALQHLIVLAGVGLVFPIVLAHAIDLGHTETAQFVALAMAASGLATVFQSLRTPIVGSGFLAPTSIGPPWLPASIIAAKTGGLSLVAGMTAAMGLLGLPLARLLPKLRFLFPPEVTGTVTIMVGVSLISPAIRAIFGLDLPEGTERSPTLITGFATLAVFVVGGARGSASQLRLYLPFLAIAIGVAVGVATGLMTMDDWAAVSHAPVIAIPSPAPWGWSFDPLLIVPFLVAMVGGSLKTMGDITACQKINDPDWKRLDMTSAAGGVMANNLASLLAGLMGSMGQQSYSTNIGLAMATGVTARIIGIACGGLMVALAFFPKIAMVFTVMPVPVLGALLIFASAFMIVTGMQIVTSRMLDMRRTFIVSLPIIFGLGEGFLSTFHDSIPNWVPPLFDSPLSTATILVILLNFVLRFGISSTAQLRLDSAEEAGKRVHTFFEQQGDAWAARTEVIRAAQICHSELIESIFRQSLCSSGLDLTVSFDELKLKSLLQYDGSPITISGHRPNEQEMLEDEEALETLATYLASTYATDIQVSSDTGTTEIRITFEH